MLRFLFSCCIGHNGNKGTRSANDPPKPHFPQHFHSKRTANQNHSKPRRSPSHFQARLCETEGTSVEHFWPSMRRHSVPILISRTMPGPAATVARWGVPLPFDFRIACWLEILAFRKVGPLQKTVRRVIPAMTLSFSTSSLTHGTCTRSPSSSTAGPALRLPPGFDIRTSGRRSLRACSRVPPCSTSQRACPGTYTARPSLLPR